MSKPRAGRQVSRPSAALARTNRPVADAAQRVEVIGPNEHVVRTARGIDGLINVLTGQGMRGRDKRTGALWVRSQMSMEELDAVYTMSWLAGKVVDKPADDMTRAGWTRAWDGFDEEADGRVVQNAERLLGTQRIFNLASKWARKDGGCIVIMGLKGENLSTPINLATVRRGSLQYLKLLERWRCYPSPRVDTDFGPHLGEPYFWRIAESAIEVHWSRVLHFRGRDVPYFVRQRNAGWDDSYLQRVVDTIKNFETSEGAVGTMMNEASIDVHFMENLAKTLSLANGDAIVEKRLLTAQVSKSIWRTMVLDAGKDGSGGDRYERKPIAFGGIDAILDRLATFVAAAAGIPKTILFEESPTGLNATGSHNTKNYVSTIASEQASKLAPLLDQYDEVFVRSTLGKMPKNYSRTFNSIELPDPLQEAQIRKLQAEADQVYLTEHVLSEGAIARELRLRGTYAGMTPEDVAMAEELADKPDPIPPGQQDPPPPIGAGGKRPGGEDPPLDDNDNPDD